LAAEGVQWVQIDEPVLVTKLSGPDIQRLKTIYETFAASVPNLNIILQTYFESVDQYSEIVALPVKGIGLDFIHGLSGNLSSIKTLGFPADKVLGAGVIDGRGIWKASLRDKLGLLEELTELVTADRLIVQSSCSLLHVPVTTERETNLSSELKNALAFADEKLNELVLLTKAIAVGSDVVKDELDHCDRVIQALQQSEERNRSDIQQAVAAVNSQKPERNLPFAERYAAQQAKWQLPLFPTTTIGSFPQSAKSSMLALSGNKSISGSSFKRKLVWMYWCTGSLNELIWSSFSAKSLQALHLHKTGGYNPTVPVVLNLPLYSGM
jgi:5-methyltetrahydropteroyltriglutamate--homocysteine methyltransferase